MLELYNDYTSTDGFVRGIETMADKDGGWLDEFGGKDEEIRSKLGLDLFSDLSNSISVASEQANRYHFILGFKYAVKLFGLLMPERQLTEMPYIELPKVEKVS